MMHENIVVRIPRHRPLDYLRDVANLPCNFATCESFRWIQFDEKAFNRESLIGVEELASQLPGVLFLERQGKLFRKGAKVASGSLPAKLDWQPITSVLDLKLPTAALSARAAGVPRKVLRLVRSTKEVPAAAVIVDFVELGAWVNSAPQVRLDCLQFSCLVERNASGQRNALVMGVPLPPLPSQHLWRRDRVLIPMGWDWDPPLDANTLQDAFELPAESYLVWLENSWAFLPIASLVDLRRTSLRAVMSGIE